MQRAADTQATASLAALREAQLQRQQGEMLLKNTTTPVVIVAAHDLPSGGQSVTLYNIGQAPAVNISIEARRVFTDDTRVAKFYWPDALPAGEADNLELDLLVKSDNSESKTTTSTNDGMFRAFEDLWFSNPLEMVIAFESIGGDRFTTTMSIRWDSEKGYIGYHFVRMSHSRAQAKLAQT
jgi:hypothetical protein